MNSSFYIGWHEFLLISPPSFAFLFSDTEVPTEDVDEKVLTRQSNPSNPVSRVSGKKLSVKHITALTIKRFHHSKRNKKGLVCEVGQLDWITEAEHVD